ncbi:histidine--tRNA ligase [Sulfurovum sp. NBC37-1]|uniref:Histidine--tRNA ligase n=1 Tax=Sulfurovum sp. (strain NBC37-1) TaxID=387093 RepID=SYH_SULNB|nr:histidine--tRNA ligase [Sulfurovum sp. NBC37-1]A6Q9Z9.1 RecName: Full=Histidine--tRNA ligase; AltName: Full=Histidyl-tRNA synthetase; Short=HisRS [Sulfurovum sp. NBC37-1]BAF72308.1 histidyl-tRNA synthetase [Sulfurovum sp. NBC37-1]
MINPLRGMKDLTFDEAQRFVHIVKTAITIAKRYGYSYIETPILEETALFKRSVGDSSDIVSKEMYQFEDKGGNDVCMRPEGTAGVVRAFISAKLDRQPVKQKFYYYGPMFRYERPQKGRLREFHQFGCESFGEASVYEDFTIIIMISQIFQALGIGFELKINSLGCPECMPPYRQNLVGFLTEISEDLCTDCNRRIGMNPIRVLDCKNEACQSLLKQSPKLIENLCEHCDTDFKKLTVLLDDAGIAYEVDTNLVRGLDYYNKTAFEFVSNEIGSQSAIAGGGRYDKLVEYLDGKPTPAVGFAIGIERIMELVQMPETKKEGYYMGAMIPEAIEKIIMLGNRKRATDKVTVEYSSKGFKSHMKGVDKANARYALLIGEDELKNGTVWLKDLETKEEKSILLSEV